MIFLKYFFDFVFCLILIIIFSPIFLILSIFIKLEDGGKVFFKQDRVGKNKKVFLDKLRAFAKIIMPYETVDDDAPEEES